VDLQADARQANGSLASVTSCGNDAQDTGPALWQLETRTWCGLRTDPHFVPKQGLSEVRTAVLFSWASFMASVTREDTASAPIWYACKKRLGYKLNLKGFLGSCRMHVTREDTASAPIWYACKTGM